MRRLNFWESVDKVSSDKGCWLWTAGRTSTGYGELTIEGKKDYAHRHSWFLHFGEHPGKSHVLHHCDTPNCVNPNHLFLGNPNTNMLDKVAKKRQSHGEIHGMAKLNEDQVREVRAAFGNGERQYVLADKYGVSDSTIANIVKRRQWRHI